MGCRCDSTKEPNMGEYKFAEELNLSSNSIILKNKRNSTNSNLKEIEIIQNKFIEEINEKEDYAIINSINIKEYLTYECLQAFEIFSNQNYKFKGIFDSYSEDFELKTSQHVESDNKEENQNEIKEESENENEMKEESENENENKEESENENEIKEENGNEIKDKSEKEIKKSSESEKEIKKIVKAKMKMKLKKKKI